ncbi:MAG: polymer-forming cytoskeletal protein [Anaerolineaceae bacterium]
MMMFAKKKTTASFITEPATERVTSVIGPGINWKGDLRGKGGVRIEGTMEGEIAMHGLVVIGETGKVTCQTLQAETVIVAGAVKGNIICNKLEIRSTGRIWGDVVTSSFSSEDGAFLRGQMRMEEKVEITDAEENREEAAFENLSDEPMALDADAAGYPQESEPT